MRLNLDIWPVLWHETTPVVWRIGAPVDARHVRAHLNITSTSLLNTRGLSGHTEHENYNLHLMLLCQLGRLGRLSQWPVF
jgi:hypothetical protein